MSEYDLETGMPLDSITKRGPATVILAVALVLGASFSLLILTRPLIWLLGVVPDDAFYYLQVARHLAHDGVSTFDGVNLTNGYHPAWMLLMTFCARVFPDRVLLLRACLGLGLVLHLATGLLLRPTLRRVVGEFWATLGAALWIINPVLLMLALQGVETSLYLLMLTLALWCYVERIDPHLGPDGDLRVPTHELARFGLTLGLAALARTEALVLAAVVIVSLITLVGGRTWKRGAGLPIGEMARVGAVIGGACLLCLLPWLLYCQATLGHLGQTSGAMKMVWAARDNRHSSLPGRMRSMLRTLNVIWFKGPTAVLLDYDRHTQLLETPLLGLFVMLILAARRHPAGGTFARLMVGLFPAILLIDCIYGLFFVDQQYWYSGLPVLVFFVAALGCLSQALTHSKAAQHRAAWLACGAGLIVFLRFWHAPLALYPHQRDVYASQPRFNALVPPGAKIGSLNAGIPGYFSDRKIINLDGLVNDAVYPYWRDQRFEQYLSDAKIEYITDEPGALAKTMRFSSRSFTAIPVAVAPLRTWHPPVRYLWRVSVGNK